MYRSTKYECDLWQGVAVFTRLYDGACGSIVLKRNGRNATESMIKTDVKKYGAEKALDTYAKLVTDWQ